MIFPKNMDDIDNRLRAIEEKLAFADVIGASQLCTRALELAPNDARLLEIGGDCAFKLWDNKTAARCYSRLARLRPDNIFYALLRLGETYERLNRYHDAVEAGVKALALGPGTIPAHLMLGRCFVALSQWKSAVEHLGQGGAGKSADTAVALVQAHKSLGQNEQAIEVLNAVAHLAKGLHLEYAAPLADHATELAFGAAETGEFDTVQNLAGILTILGALEQAETLFRFVVEAAPDNPDHAILLAHFLHDTGRTDEAVDILRALKNHPASEPITLAQGISLLDFGKKEQVVRQLRNRWEGLTSRGCGNQGSFVQLGEGFERAGLLEDALRAFQQGAEVAEPTANLLERIALSQRKLGQRQQAAQTASRLFERFPDFKSKLHYPLLPDGPEGLKYQDPEFRAYLQSGQNKELVARRLLDQPEEIREIVTLCNWGRSGTYLLSSMLDGHPEVIQMMASFYPLREIALNVDEFVASMGSVTRGVNEVVTCLGVFSGDGDQGRTFEAFDKRQAPIFSEALYYALTRLNNRRYLNPDTVFRTIHAAYAIAEGRVFTRNPIICFQSHIGSIDHRVAMAGVFPGTCFITSVRYPPRAYDSVVHNLIYEDPFGNDLHVPELTFKDMAAMDEWREGVDQEARSTVVRFEDIHNHTEFVMRWLARWLDIEWHPVLLDSTIHGKPWGMKGHTGTRRMTRKDLVMRCFNHWDEQKLKCVFHENMSEWGYWMPGEQARHELMRQGDWLWQRTFDAPFDLHSKLLDSAIANGPPPEKAANATREADQRLRAAMIEEMNRRKTTKVRLLPMLYRDELEAVHGLSPLLDGKIS